MGLLLGVELVKDRKSKEPAKTETAAVLELAKERGLLLGKGGLHGNVLRIAPALTVTEEEAAEGLDVLAQSFAALEAANTSAAVIVR